MRLAAIRSSPQTNHKGPCGAATLSEGRMPAGQRACCAAEASAPVQPQNPSAGLLRSGDTGSPPHSLSCRGVSLAQLPGWGRGTGIGCGSCAATLGAVEMLLQVRLLDWQLWAVRVKS